MIAPINYQLDVATPFQTAAQGYAAGAAIRDDQQAQQDRQLKLEAAQRQQAAQAAMQADLVEVSRSPTPQAITRLMIRWPQLSEHFARANSAASEQQRSAELKLLIPIYAAASNGRYDVAKKLLADRANAYENSGMAPDAQEARDTAQMLDQAPGLMTTYLHMMLAHAAGGPEKFADMVGKLGTESRAAAKAPTELRTSAAEAALKEAEAAGAGDTIALRQADVRSQIEDRARRYALDRDRLTSDVQFKLYELQQKSTALTDDAKKLVNESTVQAISSDQAASQMLSLADRVSGLGSSWGALSTAGEWLKNASGNQDAVTQLRNEYTRIRSTGVLKSLPPGPATDRDIAFASKGFPSETADPAQMASFLRGMAKIQQYESALNGAKAEWVNSVGHLGKPRSDIEVDGIKVPAGSTFVDFSRQFMQRIADERAAEQAAQRLQGRGYMRFATPPQTGGATGSY